VSDTPKRRIPKWLVITLIVIAVLAIGLNLTKDWDVGGDTAASAHSEGSSVEVPDYAIAATEDLSFGDVVRTQYRVVVLGDPTEDELRAVVDDVIEQAKEGDAFNAVSVGLFASEDEVDSAYTLGYAEYAPGGEWDAADTVDAGDYEAMELRLKIY